MTRTSLIRLALVLTALAPLAVPATASADPTPTRVAISQNAYYVSNGQINVQLVLSCTPGWGYFAQVQVIQPQGFTQVFGNGFVNVNNTILSDAVRRDGYAGSIRMSSRYGSVARWKRPIVANNVIALLEMPARVCSGSQRFIHNVVIRGQTCSRSDRTGSPNLDGRGRPRSTSTVIDGANRHYAPTRDATGRRRTGRPDIGAFEYRG